MGSTGFFQSVVVAAFGLIFTACGGSSQAPKEPSAVDDSTQTAPAQPEEPVATGSGVDVGMQFEDKGDSSKTDRTPPPTNSYKPGGKTKPGATPP